MQMDNLFSPLIDSLPREQVFSARKYVDANRVKVVEIRRNNPRFHIDAHVKSFEGVVQRVIVHVDCQKKTISGICSCKKSYPCKHALASLIAAGTSLDASNVYSLNQKLDHAASLWVEQLGNVLQSSPVKTTSEPVMFVLQHPSDGMTPGLSVFTYLAKTSKKGKIKPFYPSTEKKRSQVSVEDLALLSVLELSRNEFLGGHRHEYVLNGKAAVKILPQLIQTGHCYWDQYDAEHSAPLKAGGTIEAQFVWEMQPDGTQSCVCKPPDPSYVVLPTEPLCYVKPDTATFGYVMTDVPEQAVTALIQTPRIPPGQVQSFVTKLKEKVGLSGVPLPQTFQATQQRAIEPKPHLYIYRNDVYVKVKEMKFHYFEMVKKGVLLAKLSFYYGTLKVGVGDDRDMLIEAKDNALIQWTRDWAQEAHYTDILSESYGIIPLKQVKEFDVNYFHATSVQHEYYIAAEEAVDKIAALKNTVVPALKASGWQIDYDTGFLESEPLEIESWYTELHEKSEYDWFGLELGVIVHGESINLLPYLIEAFQKSAFETTADQTVILTLPKRGKLPIPAERMKAVMAVILQFVDPSQRGAPRDEIRLSRYHAGLLAEMEKAFKASELRWFGNDTLRRLSQKLADFKQLDAVEIPSQFLGTLRPYQQEAVNWMQGLCALELNGILADDMGLGKTVQVLAHLLIEKQKNPHLLPCLIIAPTSVVHHWQREIERFAPSLTALVLQGMDRKVKFTAITTHDIILTTYPLILRDQAVLLGHDYHMVILDEAQTIKNAQAKMTQVIQQLKAKHRFCLSGTPLENHLGELWSLFHFLMPGLLGTARAFKGRYRTPIETHHDETTQGQLARLIRPFILRRTKQEVIEELPPKTEIIQSIALGKAQRDLYESIRLAMHQKVRDAIDQKGLERSQIVILDALLKLRQVCCDPRLLKMEAAKQVNESAKLDALMQMLTSMCEEGRRILLFSQFTSMLSLIEEALNSRQLAYVKLIGSTQDRSTPVREFQEGKVPLFLISLKAGGTGLNLTRADTVIHYDPWWNPAAEQQATDRAHRMGQEKALFAYKLVATDTVEEKILAMQKKKGALANALFQGGNYQGKLVREDFDGLFG